MEYVLGSRSTWPDSQGPHNTHCLERAEHGEGPASCPASLARPAQVGQSRRLQLPAARPRTAASVSAAHVSTSTKCSMTYHLAYLDLRARGEPIRWVLKAVDSTFTEERIDIFTQWSARKQEFEWGRTPVLVVEGQQLHQTAVICRYLGEKHQLASGDLWTATCQQEVVEAFHDLSETVALAFLARVHQDGKQQQAMVQKVKKRLPELAINLEARITEHGWILSPEMTWVDVFVAAYLDIYESLLPGMLDGKPKTQRLLSCVRTLPPIKAWLQERPAIHKFEDPNGLF